MGNSICLDSDFLIDLLRNKQEAVNWIKEHERRDILATTIVNIFELYAGAYKTNESDKKVLAIKELSERLKILSFKIKCAEEAGRQNALLEKEGNAIEKRDLFIGTIAFTEGFALKTNNKRHFERIKGLQII